jgi:hypothetical protein
MEVTASTIIDWVHEYFKHSVVFIGGTEDIVDYVIEERGATASSVAIAQAVRELRSSEL